MSAARRQRQDTDGREASSNVVSFICSDCNNARPDFQDLLDLLTLHPTARGLGRQFAADNGSKL
jgi:hypothetical protein